MKKEEIISITEGLPLSIGRYKLHIYEDSQLKPWGQICIRGKLDHSKLEGIFDANDNIKHYDWDENLEYQFTVDYEDNGELWLGETNFGKLPDCLTTILDKLVRYQERT